MILQRLTRWGHVVYLCWPDTSRPKWTRRRDHALDWPDWESAESARDALAAMGVQVWIVDEVGSLVMP